MKLFRFLGLSLCLSFLSACNNVNIELQNALAFGAIKELNQLNPNIDKQLLLRLYESPVAKRDCFQETHGVCQYNYFLSVSSFDEQPETNIYKLKNQGEVVQINWKKTSKIDSAIINILFNTYTRAAIKNNKLLKNEQKWVQIHLDTQSISEIVVAAE